jgi:hypothetical protein
MAERIAAIEAEARAAALAEAAERVRAIDPATLVTDESGWDYNDGRDDAIAAVLAILEDSLTLAEDKAETDRQPVLHSTDETAETVKNDGR